MPPFNPIPSNAYKATPKNDARDRIEVEVGDSKQTEFYPQLKMMRWDNDVNLSVRLINHGEQNPQVVQTANRVQWKGSKIEAEFYDLPASDDLPEGASEFEIILKQKPTKNRIEFSLNTKGLKFFYQPALTAAEIAAGHVRPDHVVGSYAVYTDEDKVNIAGGKLYRSGKVGHIYRPRIEDSYGAWVWGDLSVDETAGTLTVTIPQAFLDTAVYPVRHAAGLTMGYTTVGATNASANNASCHFVKGTATADGKVQSITLFTRAPFGTCNVKGVIWLVSTKGIISNGITSIVHSVDNNWITLPYSTTEPTVSATDYYIGEVHDGNLGVTYDTGASGSGGTASNSYTTPTALGTISNDTRLHSAYATYTLTPTLTVSPSSLSFPNTAVGATSAAQTFSLSWSNLTDSNITITIPLHFEVSLNNSSWTGGGSQFMFSVSPQDSPKTIYVRFKPTSSGSKSGNVAVASTGATTQNVAVSGTGVEGQPTIRRLTGTGVPHLGLGGWKPGRGGW
jgi:hypothetical protein